MNPFRLSQGTRIVADETLPPIRYACEILRRDMRSVLTGEGDENAICVDLDASLPAESYRAQVSPEEIRLTCGGARGAVYALLSISERFLGVLAMGWWNGQSPARFPYIDIAPQQYVSPVYAVRHRGWFVNDEVLIDGWKDNREDERAVWRRIFETILRCGGNMVIPGTDRKDDGLDLLASDMGLTLTQHHAELLGARMFGRVYPQLKSSYRLYPDKFEALWREAALKYKGRRVIYAIGFRGQGDLAFWHEDGEFDTDAKRGAEISRIMLRQMEIVREINPDALFCTNLYGEMMTLYRQGHLHVPEGVIKVWADNGFGRMLSRRQGLSDPRVDAMPRHEAGENGVYFHASFYDLQAANHITQLQIPPQQIAQELGAVLDNGANDYWIINSGSVKPHIYMLDLIRAIWTDGKTDAAAHAAAYAKAYFGQESVAKLLLSYADCAVRYGPHEDSRAGDQYYHHAAREIAMRLMRGENGEVRALTWAERGDLLTQARAIAEKCAISAPQWAAFLSACDEQAAQLDEPAAQLLHSTLRMNAQVHLLGCRTMGFLANTAQAMQAARDDEAFYRASQALECAEEAAQALRGAEYGPFENVYRNDCFTDVALTADVLRGLRRYLRITQDGPLFTSWEQKHLIDPGDARIRLLLHRRNPYTDDELYARMRAEHVF